MSVADALEALFKQPNARGGVVSALEIAARDTGFQRVAVFELHPHPITGETCCSQRYEWAREGVRLLGTHPSRQNFSLQSEGFGRWVDELNAGTLLSGPVKRFPDSERPGLEAHGALSVVVVPLLAEDGAWGFVEYEDLSEEREFRSRLLETCRAFAAGIGLGVRSASLSDRLINRDNILQAVAENVGDGLFWKDAHGIYQGCNRTFARLVGLDQVSDVIGRTDYSLPFDQDACAAFHESDRRVIERGRPDSRVVSLPRVGGEPVWIETIRLPFLDDGGRVVGIVGCWQDATGRRALTEKVRRALATESLAQAAGGLSHDFNNLLMAILGHTRLALSHVDSSHGPVASELEQIMAALSKATDLSQQLVQLAQGPLSHGESIDVNERVRDLARFLKPLTRSSVSVSTACEAEQPLVAMDPGELEQAILNLVLNASDALPGGGTITIRTHNVGSDVHVDVVDDGTGISAELQAHVFEPHFTTREGSAGLGLTRCREVVERVHGRVLLESATGEGTRVSLVIPTRRLATKEEVADELPLPDHGVVLLVEDEAAVRDAVAGMLRELGLEVVEAASGEEAERLHREVPVTFDLVITDLAMPGLGGGELIDALRVREPGLPVLLMSGHRLEDVQRGALPDGVTFLQKPFQLLALKQAVARALSRK